MACGGWVTRYEVLKKSDGQECPSYASGLSVLRVGGVGSWLFEVERALAVGLAGQFAEEKAGLNILVPLVFSGLVFGDSAFDCVIEDLADLDGGVDANWLNGDHFERPVAAEADITEAGGDVYEHTEAPDGGATFEHGHEIAGFSVFHGAAQIHLVGLQHESFGGDNDATKTVGSPHIQHNFFVDEQFVVKAKIVAVGVELFVVKGFDPDITAQAGFDFGAAENHGTPEVVLLAGRFDLKGDGRGQCAE